MKYIVKAKYRANYQGFNRGGRFWSNTGLEVDETELTDDIRNEPMLIIEPVGGDESVDASKPRQRRGK